MKTTMYFLLLYIILINLPKIIELIILKSSKKNFYKMIIPLLLEMETLEKQLC